MSAVDCNVLIIGGGPAGAMTAILAGRKRPDLSIILADAEAMPRQRPCGEFLAPAGTRVLREAGLMDAILATGAQAVRGVSIIGPHGNLKSEFGVDHGMGIRRERFDHALQEQARRCSELRRNMRFSSFQRDGGHLSVRMPDRTFRARLLIGADGRHSAVRRTAGLDRRTPHRRFALACRARGLDTDNRVELHLSPFGQIGIAPLGGGEVNVNLLLAEASRPILKQRSPERLVRAAIAATPSLRTRCAGLHLSAVMATGSLPQGSDVIGDGVALVGDAAGFCDPFTGDGISFALFGARLLSDRIARLDLTAPITANGLRAYAVEYRASIGRQQRLGRCLRFALQRRRLAECLTAWLGRSPLISQRLAGGAISCPDRPAC